MTKINGKYWFIIKFITSSGITWYKIYETKMGGVAFYEPRIVKDKLMCWKYNYTIKNTTIRDYEHNFVILDYFPGIHDKMITEEYTKSRS